MKLLPPNRAVRLKNSTCPYCGSALSEIPHDVEHTIGRRFVPKGKLDGCWNLILRACLSCNRRKGQLEDDLSAITMQPDAFGEYAVDDPVLHAEATRKGAGSISRWTNKRVGESSETKELEGSFGPGVQYAVNFVMPPQVDPERAMELAKMQLSAFFYWITYDSETARGSFWPGEGVAFDLARRADWGNTLQRSFMKAVRDWEHRVHAVTADGYFKVEMRRHPSAVCWSWALEWNRNLRLIGAFGDSAAIEEFSAQLEAPTSHVVKRAKKSVTRIRSDVALLEEDDLLFEYHPPVV